MIVLSYDVDTTDAAGAKRLRKVAKICEAKGCRVQNSVFECVLDAAQCKMVQHKLEQLIDPQLDSLRFYFLGNRYKTKVEHIGTKPSFDVTEPLIF